MSPVIRAADVRRVDAPGFSAEGIATPSLGTQEHIVCRARSDAGRRGRAHSHDREEILLVTAGSATAVLGEDEVEVLAGDVVVIPAGTLHTFLAGSDGFECLTVEPRGIRFFDDAGVEYEMPEVMR
jgi:quercetin dioxygenase-like cupin family protein